MLLEEKIGALLKERNWTLGVVESATGGLISQRITSIAGSSDYYEGSVTSYSNRVKMTIVGVSADTLEQYGAVSKQTAREMAEGGRRVLGVDVCVADTGIAGPGGGTPEKPVGLFYLGLSAEKGVWYRRHLFEGDREANRHSAADAALQWVFEYLSGEFSQEGLIETHVVTCFLESANKILLLRRSGKVGSYQGKWAGVSGYVETTPDEQAVVEISEETGLNSGDVELVRSGQSVIIEDESLGKRWIVHPYLFHIRTGEKIAIDWEHTELCWITPDEIRDFDMVPGLEQALKNVWR